MKIGLIDIDRESGNRHPNLALMKLSAYHKGNGDDVEWSDGFSHYDRVYMSKVFPSSEDYRQHANADEVIKGGSGFAFDADVYRNELDRALPAAVEHTRPDYGLYGLKNTAMGFITRGCPRGCGFCIVGQKEGRVSRKVADLQEFWSGERHITLFDPNILAYRCCEDELKTLASTGAIVDFNQGLDARMIDQAKAEALAAVRMRMMRFAWDRWEDGTKVLSGLELLKKAKPNLQPQRTTVYTLVNYDTTVEQDLARICRLRKLGYWAYVMIYDKPNAPRIYRKMQRWVNNRFIFAKCLKFEDYRERPE